MDKIDFIEYKEEHYRELWSKFLKEKGMTNKWNYSKKLFEQYPRLKKDFDMFIVREINTLNGGEE